MKTPLAFSPSHRRLRPRWIAAVPLVLLLHPLTAHASMFHGETLDTVADVLTWVVLVIAPIVGIVVFLLVHILPEKIAEKKQHPQAKAIQCLCLLSLAFGGLLWPLAWLWAFTKPVGYKLAYGTDKVPHGTEDETHAPAADDNLRLRQRIAELETKLAGKPSTEKKA
jgi:Protein of unknown function (DUF3302)